MKREKSRSPIRRSTSKQGILLPSFLQTYLLSLFLPSIYNMVIVQPQSPKPGVIPVTPRRSSRRATVLAGMTRSYQVRRDDGLENPYFVCSTHAILPGRTRMTLWTLFPLEVRIVMSLHLGRRVVTRTRRICMMRTRKRRRGKGKGALDGVVPRQQIPSMPLVHPLEVPLDLNPIRPNELPHNPNGHHGKIMVKGGNEGGRGQDPYYYSLDH